MLLHDARRDTRTDERGELVLLADQDRGRWDQEQIAEGVAVLTTTRQQRRLGPYQVQAAIAECHATGADWHVIAALYGQLAVFVPSAVVELNRAVAVAMADGPAAGLVLVDRIAAGGALSGYHLLPATRADLLRRLGRDREAVRAYQEALALATSDTDRRFLARRLSELRGTAMEPTIVRRPEQHYVGVRRTVTMQTFPEVADRMPVLFGWLAERGIEPAGAPFFRYLVIDMSRELVVEAGFPVAEPVPGDGEVFSDVLPAGRYVSLTHVGHPSELVGVIGELNTWAAAQGLRYDVTESPAGDRFGCRLEIYKTDPRVQPDMSKWETELAFRLAD